MTFHLVQAAYLLATVLFVFALHWMNTPKTARRAVWAPRGSSAPRSTTCGTPRARKT
jgi:NAD/NADP transhydrogenase beta subunit